MTSTAAGTVTLTTSANTSTTFSGVMSDGSGVVGITKAGSGTLTWSGANTYTGVTRIQRGTLSIASDSMLGTAPGSPTAAQLTFGGGTLQATADLTLDSNRGVTLTGTGTQHQWRRHGQLRRRDRRGEHADQVWHRNARLVGREHVHRLTTISAGVLRIQSNAALGDTGTGSTVTTGAVVEMMAQDC